jgi:Recombination endonuclease VII
VTDDFTTRERYLFKRYAITPEMWARGMAAQDGVCGLCGRPQGTRSLCVDEDPDALVIRGFIHARCNMTVQRRSARLTARAQAYLADPPLARFGWSVTDDAKHRRRAAARAAVEPKPKPKPKSNLSPRPNPADEPRRPPRFAVNPALLNPAFKPTPWPKPQPRPKPTAPRRSLIDRIILGRRPRFRFKFTRPSARP